MCYLSYSVLLPVISLIILLTYAVTTSCVFIIKRNISKLKLYMLLNIVLTLWSLSFIFFFSSPDEDAARMWYKVSTIGFSTYYILSINIASILNDGHQKTKLTVPVIFSLCVPIVILFLFDDLRFISFYKSNGVWLYIFKSPDPWFIPCFLFIAVLLYFNLKTTELKSVITYVIFQTIPLSIGIATNVILPVFNSNMSPTIVHTAVLIYSIALNLIYGKQSLSTTSSSISAKHIISKVTDMVIITDATGKILEANNSLKELSGYSDTDLSEKDIHTLFSPKICSDKSSVKLSGYKFLTKENRTIPVNISISQIYSEDKIILGTAYVLQKNLLNLTDKAAEEAAVTRYSSQTSEKLKEWDKLKTDFLCNVSHELRTPLNLMISSLKLSSLKISQNHGVLDTALMHKHFHIMNQNCFRLTRIINNIIDITKIDAGSLELNLSNNNIVDIVEETVLSVASHIKDKEITLIFDTDVEEKFLACDPDQIQRILLNLISNAVKFNNDGREIYVSIADSIDSVKISVKDNGIGISLENQPLIFERFIQVDKSLTRQHEGSGMGLTITRYLVELHKGTIALESEPNIGSTFTITLPVYLVPKGVGKKVSTVVTLNEKVNIEFSDVY
ncbi:PAS domain-containing sensor histidine kinase [Ruminiclostridium cellulolyticum]|uniref:histidine kinase n=1 Tax=Ruminiclostridium cellulolyticum (strain ATCC 35319 / DSM 5812 / JCM 6584 / H10) TaxID=394503 RepID=B8I1N6_RUMCH|nr:PAS domain-containing sensor histidine kinase [Ruminiclostridium cellulolyticum]ACL77671.1 PAS/PAC sensor signal transduction histidine kinase [Ruminiclostridium cellulolyticum H10]